MRVSEYIDYDAVGLAELIRSGQVSAHEVHDAARQAIDQVDPSLSAVVGDVLPEPLACDPAGVFAGIPFAIKDLGLHAAGVPTRNGSRLFGDGVAFPEDTALMRRFRAAGLSAVARTRTPEFGFNADTAAVADGSPTRNPWDPTRSPGGSSGGSAALVATRALPLAHGSDGGGSLRGPAASCGLVGLKPSRGRISPAPDSEPLRGLAAEFALTRTVRDTAALLDAVHGAEPGDRYLLPGPTTSYSSAVRRPPTRLRIALGWDLLGADQTLDPEVRDAVEAVARVLENLGHDVDIAAPTVDRDAYLEATTTIWSSYLADAVSVVSAALGVPASRDVLEATTVAAIEHGARLTAGDLYAAERAVSAVTRGFGEFFTEYDALLNPTLTVPSVPLGFLDANDPTLDAPGWFRKVFAILGTDLYNANGMPAISLPLGTSREGLPIGVQLGATLGAEHLLLSLAGRLETALPWSDRTPLVVAA